jgi:hypothetical protein
MEVILYPDAALTIIGYLRSELAARADTATVGTRVPDIRPDRFVRVERVGGVRTNLVTDSALVTVECWAATEAAAVQLGQLVRALIFAAEGTTQTGVVIYQVTEVGGLAHLPDPDTEHERYVFTTQIGLRGTAE